MLYNKTLYVYNTLQIYLINIRTRVYGKTHPLVNFR